MNWRSWCYKQNRTIAGCVATLVFSCIVFTVIYSLLTSPEQYEFIRTSRSFTGDNNIDSCKIDECTMSCQSLDENRIEEIIIQSANLPGCTTIKKLTINNTNFPMKTVSPNWLQGLKYQVDELNLLQCHFETIEAGAFLGLPFNNLKKLQIIDARMQVFLKDAFSNIKSLEEFSYDFYDGCNLKLTVEAGAFDGMDNLHTLLIMHSLYDSESILNITSHTHFLNLATIDFSHNFLERVDEYSFINTPKLQKLLLSGNKIKTIDKKAFEGINVLQSIYMDTNQLETLEEGIFDMINTEYYIGVITAYGNPWKCDCDLVWFKDFVLKENSSVCNKNPPKCDGKDEFENTVFCTTTKPTTISTTTVSTTTEHQTTTSTKSTTTEISTESTSEPTTAKTTDSTEHTTQEMPFPCNDITEISHDFSSKAQQTFIEEKILIINANLIVLDFYDWDDTMNTEIKVRSNINNHSLIYRNADSYSDFQCLKNLPKTIILNLDRNSTYIMCLVDQGFKNEVSPQACFGIKTLEEKSARAWLHNSDKMMTISVSLILLLICILVTAIAVFCCIRQNPKLIKGNKRVIIVGTKETEAIVMPKNYEVPSYITPSSNMSGYMTPSTNSVLYDKINYMAALKRKKSESRQSIINHVNQIQTKTSMLVKQEDIYGPSVSLPIPPPLPPFHPSKRYVNEDFEIAEEEEEEEDHYSVV